MRNTLSVVVVCAVAACAARAAQAGNLLLNGNLDQTQSVEIIPGFFNPKPADWVNEGSRANSGPYEDELSSEPWAGPAPTPVTADGSGLDSPDGCGGPDCAVFFKAFTGNTTNGAATGHLYQDVPAMPGVEYVLTGWAGAEPNFLGGAQLALEFLDGGGSVFAGAVLDLVAAGLFDNNGEPFDYKQYMVQATAPAGTAQVRARVSMIDGLANPAGGGQALVVDDFDLSVVPEPATGLGLVVLSAVAFARRRR